MTPRGPAAAEIAELAVVLTVAGTLCFLVFAVALVLAARRRVTGADVPSPAPEDGERDRLRPGWDRWLIVGGGVVLPAVGILVSLVWTIETMIELDTDPPSDAVQVEVTGEQWQWNVVYPDSGISLTDELVIPVDRPVVVDIRSADVVHSFWVPALNGKLDAIPERTNTLVIEADETGDLTGRCAEFCGLNHTSMDLAVVVLSEADFADWQATATRGDVSGDSE